MVSDRIINMKSKEIVYISSTICKYQIHHNMSDEECAKYFGVSKKKLRQYEAGTYDFTIRELADIADKMDMILVIKLEPIDKGQE